MRAETINCLQCRHCELAPQTDFSKSLTVIRCAKSGERHTPILSTCGLANPEMAKPRHLHKEWVKGNVTGDRAKRATPVLLAYLRARWAKSPARQLEEQTGRSVGTLRAIVKLYEIGGQGTATNRRRFNGGLTYGFTPEQTTWLMRAYADDAAWPHGKRWRNPDVAGENAAKRERIIRVVASMGPSWNWNQIQHHVEKQMQVQYRARRTKRLASLAEAPTP